MYFKYFATRDFYKLVSYSCKGEVSTIYGTSWQVGEVMWNNLVNIYMPVLQEMNWTEIVKDF